MAKKYGFNPLILLSGTPGDDVVIGGATGQSTTDPFACSFETWQTLFSDDYDLDDDEDFDDYRAWFISNNFGSDAWNEWNSGTSMNPGDPHP